MKIKSLYMAGMALTVVFFMVSLGILCVTNMQVLGVLSAGLFMAASFTSATLARRAGKAEKTIRERLPWGQMSERNVQIKRVIRKDRDSYCWE